MNIVIFKGVVINGKIERHVAFSKNALKSTVSPEYKGQLQLPLNKGHSLELSYKNPDIKDKEELKNLY